MQVQAKQRKNKQFSYSFFLLIRHRGFCSQFCPAAPRRFRQFCKAGRGKACFSQGFSRAGIPGENAKVGCPAADLESSYLQYKWSCYGTKGRTVWELLGKLLPRELFLTYSPSSVSPFITSAHPQSLFNGPRFTKPELRSIDLNVSLSKIQLM